MEDKGKVYTDRDIHKLIKIFEKSGDLILNKDRLCGSLGLTVVEKDEIRDRVNLENSGNYGFLSLMLTKWISLNGGKANAHILIETLRDEGFNSTAGELLGTLLQECKTQPIQPTTESLVGSQREFEEFLRMDQHELQHLKHVKFDNIKILNDGFLKCLQICTAMESFKITRPYFNLLLIGRAWLPNLKEFELDFCQERSERKDYPGTSLEHLICFYKTNKSEDIWSTCQQVKVELKCPKYVLKTNGNGTEFVIDAHYFKNVFRFLDFHTNSFAQMKKLGLSLCCINLPLMTPLSSLTHLSLTEVTLDTGHSFDEILRALPELSSLHVKCSSQREKIDLASLPPKMTHLSLFSIQITCTCSNSGSSSLNLDLKVLALSKCNFDQHLLNNLNSVFKSISKCYFRPEISMDQCQSHLFLKKILEIEGMELMTVMHLPRSERGCEDFDEVEEILALAGVPKHLVSFTLEKNNGKWIYNNMCESLADVYLEEVYSGGEPVKFD